MELIIGYALYYLYLAIVFWLTSAVAAGFYGTETNVKDFWSSLLWPISVATLIGVLTRLLVEYIKQKKQTKEKNEKPTKKEK